MSAGWVAVITALIAGACAVLGQSIIAKNNTKIANNNTKELVKELYAELDKRQAVTDTKMDELTREVRDHNNFARRMPVLEEKVARLEQEVNRQ